METTTQKVAVPLLGVMNINFFDCAYQTFEFYNNIDEIERQKTIKHLGLISSVFDNVSHSRWDYLMLQCGITEITGKVHAGDADIALGSIKIDGIVYNGEAIIKSWFLLSNLGHAKNTLGDEKFLTNYLLNHTKMRRFILNKIKDKDLRDFALKTILNNDYSNLHYVLSILRVYTLCGSRKSKNLFIILFKALLLTNFSHEYKVDSHKLEKLKNIFNMIRQLSIIAIDSHYSHFSLKVDLMSAILNLKTFISKENGLISSLFDSLYTELYLNSNVICRQAEYSLNMKKLFEQSKYTFNEIFNNLLFTTELVKIKSPQFISYSKVTLENDMYTDGYNTIKNRLASLLNEFTEIIYDVDINPISNEIYINFFISKSISMPTLHKLNYIIVSYLDSIFVEIVNYNDSDILNIAHEIDEISKEHSFLTSQLNEIKNQIMEQTYSNFNYFYYPKLNRVFEQFFLDVLKYFLKSENLTLHIEKNKYHHFGFLAPDFEQKNYGVIQSAIKIENEMGNNDDRVNELKQLNNTVNRKFDGYKLFLISRTKILDMSKAPGNRLQTDIDSAILKISKESTILDLHEAKNNKRGRENKAVKDIKQKLVPTLNTHGLGYRVLPHKGFGAKLRMKIK
ncbi:hypothetical protein [Peribacillus sp. R9-11]|uniref:hypothetical protein n=1 Tax=Peribacillus sp. R9-11 TaxID=3073271 RepID=UPI0028683F5E|nr:hypothetical protein [Peribacillus sp. R9-11]WMX58622.1 hypothetical protein RE409_29435 [Peribacillus sp. R9-11]